MTTTGADLLIGFSKFINDYWSSTTTSAGAAGGGDIIDTALGRFGDNFLIGGYVRPTGSTNQFVVRRVTGFTQSTGNAAVTPVFAAQTATSEAYEYHKYDPAKKFDALNKARFDIAGEVFKVVYDDTITADGRSNVFTIPSTINEGPSIVLIEDPVSPDSSWNFLTTPRQDALTGWTASSVTATIVNIGDEDLLIPKYDSSATKLVAAGAGTYDQVVGDMRGGITAAIAAGREMSYVQWIYSNVAGITVQIITDAGDLATSSAHGGNGWELLAATGNVASGNATTLTARVEVAGAGTYWLNRGWFFFGDPKRVTERFWHDSAIAVTRRDNSTQTFGLASVPGRGRQLRLIGKGVLTSLGNTIATQPTNTMEVDEMQAELLYARAAEILFAEEGISADNQSEVVNRIQLARQRIPKLRENWALEMPQRSIVGPYAY